MAAGRTHGTPGTSHDAAWFEALVRQHATAVHRFMVRRAGRDEAEDLAADVLTVAWRRRADVPDGAELPWLYRTAGFVVANHRRKGRPIPVGDVPDEVDSDDPAVRAIQEERVREVLGALSPRDREILLLNAWEGLIGRRAGPGARHRPRRRRRRPEPRPRPPPRGLGVGGGLTASPAAELGTPPSSPLEPPTRRRRAARRCADARGGVVGTHQG